MNITIAVPAGIVATLGSACHGTTGQAQVVTYLKHGIQTLRIRAVVVVFHLLLALAWTAAAAAQIASSKPFLMAFHACDSATADCTAPRNHRVYLAESNDGATWSLVPGWTTFAGSVPDVIQRGRTLYIYTAFHEVARYNLDAGTSDRVSATVSGLPTSFINWVDPSLYVDDQGRLVLFFLYAPLTGGDPARCPSGVTTCTKQFLSATEVSGSNGSQFTVDSGDRATIGVNTTGTPTSASDPDIFYDGTQFVLYISHGPSISVWTSPTLRGTYTQSTALPNGLLSNDTGGVPSGYFDAATARYWTFAHTGRNGVSVIRRAVHTGLTQQLAESSWATVMTGPGLGFSSTTSVESPGFAVTRTVPSAPANLAYAVSGSTVVLTWSPSAGATSYDIEVGSRAGAVDLATLSATGTTLTGIAPAGTYYVRVRGRNGAGTSTASNEVTFSVGGSCPALGTPGPLSATVVGRAVTLAWGGVGGATSYVLEAGSTSGSSDIVTSDTRTTATSLTATAPPGVYYVRIRAQNACGTSAPSNEVIVTVQ